MEWKQTACILCECNCGIEVRLGGDDGRRFERIRGDKAHPASAGYTCEKALRLDHYQNGRDRLTSPLRRRADGTFEEIDWDTAIARGRRALRRGARHPRRRRRSSTTAAAGRGTTSAGAYSGATRARSARRYRSNALAQEKTGEFWVNAQMMGAHGPRPTSSTARSALFVGKNPWQSPRHPARPHDAQGDRPRSRPHADRDRPAAHRDRRARRHPPPGAARHRRVAASPRIGAVLVQEDLLDRPWLAEHADRRSTTSPPALRGDRRRRRSARSPASTRTLVRRTARAIAARGERRRLRGPRRPDGRRTRRSSSYLEKLLWLLTGNFAKPGAQYIADEPRGHRPGRRTAPARSTDAARSPAPASSPASCPPT